MLSQDQVEFYRENGFLVLPEVLSAAEVAALCRVTDELVAAAKGVEAHTELYDLEDAHTPARPKVRRLKTPHKFHAAYAEVTRHAGILAAAGMGINPGNHPSTSVATASVAQMCGAWPGPLMAGVFAVGVSGALTEDIVENPIRPVDGEIAIPDGPGLGVRLDEAALKRLRVDA